MDITTSPLLVNSCSRDDGHTDVSDARGVIEGEVFFGEVEGVLFIRLVGAVRYTSCAALDHFVDQLFGDDTFDHLVVDLRQAESIDSTNLGILVKIAHYAQQAELSKPALICHDPEMLAVIQSMGIHELYRLCLKNEAGCRCKVFTKVEAVLSDVSSNLQRVMLDAHEQLAEMSSTNHDLFKGVIGALKGDC